MSQIFLAISHIIPPLKENWTLLLLLNFMERRPDGKISISTKRVFERTPFLEKLGLQVLNIENSEHVIWDVELEDDFKDIVKISGVTTMKIHRAIVTEKNVIPVIKPKILNNVKITPLFFVRFGEGRFLISLIFENENIQNAKVKNILLDLIANKNSV